MRLPLRRRPAGRQLPTGERTTADRSMRRRPAGAGRGAAGRAGAGRAAGRPQLRRRSGQEPELPSDARASRRTGRLTGRAAVLGLALCAVLLTLAYPMRQYLTQRQQISQLESHQRSQRDQVAALRRRQQEWRDPAYVKAQARKRLQFVMPGEIGYVVLDPGRAPAGRPPGRQVTVTPQQSTQHTAWYSQLWGTVRTADSAR